MTHPNTNNYFRNPKRKYLNNKHKTQWYDYYAGYSDEFVEDVLDFLNLKKGSVVFDPWNGSGTTTYVSEKKGYNAIGFDINPVMPIIASSRRIIDLEDINQCCIKIKHSVNRLSSIFIPNKDPLLYWLSENSVIFFRRIERAIQKVTLSRRTFMYASNPIIYKKLLTEPNAAYFYVALFRTIKEILGSFKASNPTWIKQPTSEEDKLDVNLDLIYDCFVKHVNLMFQSALSQRESHQKTDILLNVASSRKIPLNNIQVDAIITSPPYCTRIDYAIATRLELAVMGLGNNNVFDKLRSDMIGTTKILNEEIDINSIWGETANKFLTDVRNHYSKASKTYYIKQYLQYFSSTFESLEELNRILKSKGLVVIVVQDSYYKEVHLDLAQIYLEMALNIGWVLKHSESYLQPQTLAGINKFRGKYRKKSSAVEQVLVFQKEG